MWPSILFLTLSLITGPLFASAPGAIPPPAPPSPGGAVSTAPRLFFQTPAEDFDPAAFHVSTLRAYDYTFAQAPTDWRPEGGTWDITSRWSCAPAWAWFVGESEGLAAIWNKRRFTGDVAVEAYVALRMGVGDAAGYKLPNDLNLTLCGDGRNVGSGYAFVFGGHHNQATQLWRQGQVVAETRDPQFLLPSLADGMPPMHLFHRRWFLLQASRLGSTLRFSIDGRPALEYTDPDPLPGGQVALWTWNNSLVVARVKVYYEHEEKLQGNWAIGKLGNWETGQLRNQAEWPDSQMAQISSHPSSLIPHPSSLIPLQSPTHPFRCNDFEADLGDWVGGDGEQGATVALEEKTAATGRRCLRVTNPHSGGDFMVQAVAQAFDVRQFPVLRWAYRVPPEVRVNFFLTVGREEYELIFTNPDHPSPTARPLGRIPSVVADGEWHEAEFNLRTLLAGNGADSATISDFGFRISDFGRGSGFRNSQFAIRSSQSDTASVPYSLLGQPLIVTQVRLGVQSRDYLMCGVGGNPAGATYWIDDFALLSPGGPDLRLTWTPPDPPSRNGTTKGKEGKEGERGEGRDGAFVSYSYALDTKPDTEPDMQPEGRAATVAFPRLASGRWHFHLRARGADGQWGPTTHRAILVDHAPPEVVNVTPSPGARDGSGCMTFQLADASGVDPATVALEVAGTTFTLDDPALSFDPITQTVAFDLSQGGNGTAADGRWPMADGRWPIFQSPVNPKSEIRNPKSEIGTASVPYNTTALPVFSDGETVEVQLTAADWRGHRLNPPYRTTWVMDLARDATPPPAPVVFSAAASPLSEDTFEGLGEWHSLGSSQLRPSFPCPPLPSPSLPSEDGAVLSRDDTTAAAGQASLKLYNPRHSGPFACVVRDTPFDAGRYPFVSFDYRVGPNLRVDFIITLPTGEQRSIIFTDNDNPLERLGAVPGVVADGAWHHVEFDLYAMLREAFPTAVQFVVERITLQDMGWCGNTEGEVFHLDNFRLLPRLSGLREQTFTAWSHDAGGIAGYAFALDTIPDTVPGLQDDFPTSEIAIRNSQFAIRKFSTLPGGPAWLHARVQDRAGNWSETTHLRLFVDADVPTCGEEMPPRGTEAATAALRLRLADPGGIDPQSIEWVVNGTPYRVDGDVLTYHAEHGVLLWNGERAAPEPVVFPDGSEVTVELRTAADFAGNVLPEPFRWTWRMNYRLDQTPPQPPSVASPTHPGLYRGDFERDYGWSKPFDGSTRLRRDRTTAAEGRWSLRATCRQPGLYGGALFVEPFDAARYPVLTFDYKLQPGVAVNLLFRLQGIDRWWQIPFTGSPDQPGVLGPALEAIADDTWHRAAVDLAARLRAISAEARNLTITQVALGDLTRQANAPGRSFWIDNVTLCQPGPPPVRLAWRATDATGITAYSVAFDQQPDTIPDETPEVGSATPSQHSEATFQADEPGLWYAHVRARDGAGHWSPAGHCFVVVEAATASDGKKR